MKFKSLTLTSCLAAAITALPALSLAAPKSVEPVGTEAFEVLKDFRAQAYQAAEHASELQSIVRSPNYGSWEDHAYELEALKNDINKMGQILSQLEKIRDSAAPSERAAIDRAAPLLKLMADNTRAAVQFLNKHQGNFWLPAYGKDIDNLANESRQLSSSMGQFIQFAKVHSKEKHLEKTLGLEAGS